MIFNGEEIKITKSVLSRKIGLNRVIINTEEKYTEAKLFLTIKESIKNNLDDQPKINSLSLTITKSLINYKKKNLPNEIYIGLKEYSKNNNLRIGVIKKILNLKGYIVENHPTGKSFRMNVVFTTYHKYKNSNMKSRISEILILWKKDFLDRIIKRSIELVNNLSEIYTYSKPRSINECLNMIKIHYEYTSNYKFISVNDVNEFLNTTNINDFYDNKLNRFKILKRYLNFYTKNYNN